MNVFAMRLTPGADLRRSLRAECSHRHVDAACIISCVGSLRQAMIRFADQPEGTLIAQKLEIISLSGTLSQQGAHLHIAVSDNLGQIRGGHLMAGALVYTTAEIVVGVIPDLIFDRQIDLVTGFKELQISSQK
jgi:hypothetical protein